MMIKLISLIGTKINIFCGGKDLAFENFILGATGWICV
jgi:dihydrodipicolinate synthase/N-acetylneuraminate lyase